MKVLYSYDKGSNCFYMEDMLDQLDKLGWIECKTVRLIEYVNEVDQNDYDVLIYQTFPNESQTGKFNVALSRQGDTKYHNFKGKKFLLDSFDDCSMNGYTRFPDSEPRIKVCATDSYRERYNCVFIIPAFHMRTWFHPKKEMRGLERNIKIHCAFNTAAAYPHTIRQEIMAKLKADYADITSFDRIPIEDYPLFLRQVRISVGAPGYGQCSHAAYSVLQAGACLLHHESINEIKLLPHVDLTPGIDYISFTMDTFERDLQYLLKNSSMVKTVGRAGQESFYNGIDLDKSCSQFLELLK
jgi:hypothetical protein